MHHKKTLTILLAALCLGGCGVFHHQPKILVSTSDTHGVQQAWVPVSAADCGKRAICNGLGAGWSDNEPGAAVLVAQTQGAYEVIHDAVLDIDGRRVTLTEAPLPTRYSDAALLQHRYDSPAGRAAGQTSTRGFRTSLDVLRQVQAAQRVTLTVHAGKRHIEGVVVDKHVDSAAYRGIDALLARVDEIRDAR